MGTTPGYAWPYPELTDPPDGPAQIKALAQAIEATMTATRSGIPIVQTGSLSVAVNAATTSSTTVTFPRAFTAIPSAVANLNTGSGSSADWHPRMIGVSATAATLFLKGPSVTFTFPCQWVAALNPPTPIATGQQAPAPAPAPTIEEGWHLVTATCHTSGCPAEGTSVPNIAVPDDPAAWGWSGIVCGSCGQPINDLQVQS